MLGFVMTQTYDHNKAQVKRHAHELVERDDQLYNARSLRCFLSAAPMEYRRERSGVHAKNAKQVTCRVMPMYIRMAGTMDIEKLPYY
jgi:hypothetical protein